MISRDWAGNLVRALVCLQPFTIALLTVEHSGSLTARAAGDTVGSLVFIGALFFVACMMAWDWFGYVRQRETRLTRYMNVVYLVGAVLVSVVALIAIAGTDSIVLPSVYAASAISLFYASLGVSRDASDK